MESDAELSKMLAVMKLTFGFRSNARLVLEKQFYNG